MEDEIKVAVQQLEMAMEIEREGREFSLEMGDGGRYGPSSVSGPDASRRPDERELAVARALGRLIATLAQAVKGLQAQG